MAAAVLLAPSWLGKQFGDRAQNVCLLISLSFFSLFAAKLAFCPRILLDEIQIPPSSAAFGPVPILIMLYSVQAGPGLLHAQHAVVGVWIGSILQICFCGWFVYLAIRTRTLPEPYFFMPT